MQERESMLKEVVKEIDNAKEKLDYLISVYGLAHKKVMEQSMKLDKLISQYYSVKKLKRAWIM